MASKPALVDGHWCSVEALRAVAGAVGLVLAAFELGYVPLSQTGAEFLFEVFSQRYERGSTIATSNLPFDEWTSVFGVLASFASPALARGRLMRE